MSHDISAAIDPGIKTGTIIMPLTEEKIGFGFAGVYPDLSWALCMNIAILARNISRRGRNKTATLFIPSIIWCRYNFPEIKNSRVRLSYMIIIVSGNAYFFINHCLKE
jgi:hypothetical protein